MMRNLGTLPWNGVRSGFKQVWRAHHGGRGGLQPSEIACTWTQAENTRDATRFFLTTDVTSHSLLDTITFEMEIFFSE
ncbi:hypothetical protein WG66_012893 [Moniliophthora roreri]|nr:hypothetical protein WG66_012893 [Moniliophthora roreri]